MSNQGKMTDEQRVNEAAALKVLEATGVDRDDVHEYSTDLEMFKAGAAWRDRNPNEATLALVEAMYNLIDKSEWLVRRTDPWLPIKKDDTRDANRKASEVLSTFLKSCGVDSVEQLKSKSTTKTKE